MKSQCMDCPLKKCGRCREVAVSGDLTVYKKVASK